MSFTFKRMCSMLAARHCYEAGLRVEDIAASAKVSTSTIRRWLRATSINRTVRS